jgi:hypothetical protein
MELDVRVPIGFLFTLLGTILVATGIVAASPLDAWAGMAMLVFSFVCFGLAWRVTGRKRAPSASPHR